VLPHLLRRKTARKWKIQCWLNSECKLSLLLIHQRSALIIRCPPRISPKTTFLEYQNFLLTWIVKCHFHSKNLLLVMVSSILLLGVPSDHFLRNSSKRLSQITTLLMKKTVFSALVKTSKWCFWTKILHLLQLKVVTLQIKINQFLVRDLRRTSYFEWLCVWWILCDLAINSSIISQLSWIRNVILLFQQRVS